MDLDILIQILGATLRVATPVLLACLAGLYSERSGIIDIGLDGKMLIAAFASAATAAIVGNVWVALLAAVAASSARGFIHGFASISLRGTQLISGRPDSRPQCRPTPPGNTTPLPQRIKHFLPAGDLGSQRDRIPDSAARPADLVDLVPNALRFAAKSRW